VGSSRRAILIGLFLFLPGCGQNAWKGVGIEGTVNAAGVPLPKGSISFLPAPGQTGPSATGIIENGRFRILGADGPLPGPHKVLVYLDFDPKKSAMGPSGLCPVSPPSGKTRWETAVEIPAAASYLCDLKLD
jgi:hypothetical protein